MRSEEIVVVKDRREPFVLGKRGEEILEVMRFYRYMTALDVCFLMYAPSSLTWVRSMLAKMCGGEDFMHNQYLYRFRLPDVAIGNQKIYTLGSKGRDFLSSELGIAAEWYFRPEKVRHLSYGHLMHSLALTRFLVAARVWARRSTVFTIPEVRISYDLATAPFGEGGVGKKTEPLAVVPDAWLVFEGRRGAETVLFPVLLEIDGGTEYRQRFKRHVAARIEFVRGGEYEKLFGTKAVMIVYATTGERPEYQESRRRALCEWTMEVLEEKQLLTWAGLFRFAAFSYGEIYTDLPFGKLVWYRPGEEKPVGLFAG